MATGDKITIARKDYVDTGLGTKQDALVSGTNIKSINGGSVLGVGDLVVTDSTKLPLAGGTLTGALNIAKATVASSATTSDIWTGGNLIDFTGVATVTAFPTAPQAGAERSLICAEACSFTAGANMLIDGVLSGTTVTCAVGDTVIVRAISTTQFKLTLLRAAGLQQTLVSGTNIKTVNGGSILGSGDIIISGGNLSGSTKKLSHLVTSTEYFIPNHMGGYPASNTAVFTVNKTLFIPFILSENMSITSMLASIQTAATSNTFTMAIYSSVNNTPSSYISGTAALSTGVTGGISGAITTANLLKDTLYYFAFSCTSTAARFYDVIPALNFGCAPTVTLFRPFTVLEGDQDIPNTSTVFTKRSLGNNEHMLIGIKE